MESSRSMNTATQKFDGLFQSTSFTRSIQASVLRCVATVYPLSGGPPRARK